MEQEQAAFIELPRAEAEAIYELTYCDSEGLLQC